MSLADADSAALDGPLVPNIPLDLKLTSVLAGVAGALAIAASWLLDHPLFGLLVCLGLALGLLNVLLVQRGVAKVTAGDHPSKRQMAYNSIGRLALITGFAFVIGFLVKPDGLGVFVGLALFQAIFVLRTTLPVVKGLRQQS